MPEPIISESGAKIYDLQNPTKKMSKTGESEKGFILLLDDVENARKKIMSAVTDSDNKVYFDRENKPGISNLMTIYSNLTGKTIEEIEKEFQKSNYGEFKSKVADAVVSLLETIQSKYREIINSDIIDNILNESNEKVRKIAEEKVRDVYTKIGLGR